MPFVECHGVCSNIRDADTELDYIVEFYKTGHKCTLIKFKRHCMGFNCTVLVTNVDIHGCGILPLVLHLKMAIFH